MVDKRPFAKIDTAYHMNLKWYKMQRAMQDAMPDASPVALRHAVRLCRDAHHASILYCRQNGTDGVFPVAAIKILTNILDPEEDAALTYLFESGMWINHPGGMAEVRDYLDHQTPSEEMKSKSDSARKAARARWSKNAERNAERINDVQCREEERREEESNTSPNGEVGASSEAPAHSKEEKRASRIKADWMPSQEIIDTLKAEYPNLDYRAEHQNFIDYWIAKPGQAALKLDWDATWRRWMRKAGKEQAEKASRPPYRNQNQIMADIRRDADARTSAMQGNALNLIEGSTQ